MSKKDHGFLPGIWLKVDHFFMQISASLENMNYVHNNVLLPWSSVCGLGGLVRAKKENKAVRYLPMCCNKSKIQPIPIFYVTNFHQVLPSQPISVPTTLHVTYSFQSSLFYYLCRCKCFQFSRAGNMLPKQILLLGDKKYFAWNQKQFCFLDTNFASETYVSQFSHNENNFDQFPVPLAQ